MNSSTAFLPSIAASTLSTLSLRFDVILDQPVNVVSFKKLLKDAEELRRKDTLEAPPHANPALQARLDPTSIPTEEKVIDATVEEPPNQPNRFGSVIEKIERLYRGIESDEEGAEVSAHAGSDEYDTDDSFIDDRELDEYFSAAQGKAKYSGFFVNRGDLEQIPNESHPSKHSLDFKRKEKKSGENIKVAGSMKGVGRGAPGMPRKRKVAGEDLKTIATPRKKKLNEPPAAPPSVTVGQSEDSKDVPEAMESHDHDKLAHSVPDDAALSESKKQQIEVTQNKSDRNDQPGEVKMKKVAGQAMLEKAILELQVLVGSVQPITAGEASPADPNLDPNSSQSQSRMPRMGKEVKAKLSRVARLAARGDGKVPPGVLLRLVDIMRPLMQPITLKKHLKSMVDHAISANESRKRHLDIGKAELALLVKSKIEKLQSEGVTLPEAHSMVGDEPGTSNQSAAEKPFQWDASLENRICQIYEQFMEGIDANRGIQSRRLYGELADLWPNGWMDSAGIKSAVTRVKQRNKKREIYITSKLDGSDEGKSGSGALKGSVGFKLPNAVKKPKINVNAKKNSQLSKGTKKLLMLPRKRTQKKKITAPAAASLAPNQGTAPSVQLTNRTLTTQLEVKQGQEGTDAPNEKMDVDIAVTEANHDESRQS